MMPRTNSSIDKIRVEFALVNETPIRTNAAAATFDAAKKLDEPNHNGWSSAPFR